MAEKEESQNRNPPPVTEKEEQPPSSAAAVEQPADTEQKEEQPPSSAAAVEQPDDTDQKEEQPPAAPPAAVVENISLAAVVEKEASVPEKVKEDAADFVDEAENAENENQQQPPPPRPSEEPKIPQSLISFKEESNVVADLSDFERKALLELKQLLQEALINRQITVAAAEEEKKKQPSSDPPKTEGPTPESDKSTEIKPPQEQKSQEEEEEVSIWGVPLLKDDRSDVILLKFLRARDFKVRDAFVMIKNTIRWRKDFGIEALMNEDLGDDLEKAVFMHGFDREGHPVCYNVYGEFQNKQLYHNTFSDEGKRIKFLRWRIQLLERSIRKLNFRPGGVSTIFHVNDLKNLPGPGKRELRIATKQALELLQDNYPEFVAKQVFINVPWWYLAFYTMMINPFMTQRTKSKFVFAGPSKSPKTLFKYISPEHVPIQYGGLSADYCDRNPEFTINDRATEITIRPSTKQNVEIIIFEKCIIVWEIRVVGWEVSYGAEFVPDEKDKYTIIIQNSTKLSPDEKLVVCHRFKVDESGKILLTVDNPTSKKKKLLYRFKVEPFPA